MSRRASLVLCGLFVYATNGPLGAQRVNGYDLGVTAARFPDDDALAIGPSLRASVVGLTGRFFYSGEAGGMATPGASSGFAMVEGGMRQHLSDRFVADFTSGLSTTAGTNSSGGVGTAEFRARGMLQFDRGGAWLRGSGQASDRLNSNIAGAGVDVGTWWATDAHSLTASVQREWTRGETYLYRFHQGYAGTTPVQYTEASLAYRNTQEDGTLDISATTRRDTDAPRLWETGFTASLVHWNSPSTGVTVSYAHQLADWIHGADAAYVFTIGGRYRPGAGEPRSRRILVTVDAEGADGQRTLRVQAPEARTVEVMGDFSDWAPKALAPSGALFASSVKMAGGSHRIVVRINGGEWKPAANTPAVDDEFGGKAGVLVAP